MGGRRQRRNSRLVRILQLLNLLSNNPIGYTVSEILARQRIRRRTFYRDLEALQQAGIFLERRRLASRQVRYRLPQEYRFVRTSFDENELFSLFFAKNLLKPLEGTPFARGFESALDKIYRLLPANVQNYCVSTESFFVFKQPFSRSYRDTEANLRALKDAILSDRVCEIDYDKGDGIHRHHIHPYFMTYVDGLLYVIAHSEQRGERRTFRVDRIRSLRILDRGFRRPHEFTPEGFDPERHLARGLKIFADEPVRRVALEFSPELARLVTERTWHPSQKLRRLRDGRLELTLQLPVSPELVSWILSFGRGVRVVEPRDLADRVLRELRDAAARYRA